MNSIDELISEAEALHTETQQVLGETEPEEWEHDLTKYDVVALIQARRACIRDDYQAAVELFGRVFSRIDLAGNSVGSLNVASYALALARVGDVRARKVAVAAEERFKVEVGRKAALGLWNIAEAYALLKDAQSAVRCLRASLIQEPSLVRTWLTAPKEMEVFLPIRSEPTFAMFEGQVLAVPGEKMAVAK